MGHAQNVKIHAGIAQMKILVPYVGGMMFCMMENV